MNNSWTCVECEETFHDFCNENPTQTKYGWCCETCCSWSGECSSYIFCQECKIQCDSAELLSTTDGWYCPSCLKRKWLIITETMTNEEMNRECNWCRFSDGDIVKLFGQFICMKCLKNKICT
jgi:hypothetical protein